MIRRVPPIRNFSMPVQAPEIVETDNTRVACDGGGGPLGHPKIFINVDKPQICWCTYCGLPYVCLSYSC